MTENINDDILASCKTGDLANIRRLLDSGVSMTPFDEDKTSKNALITACENNQRDVVEFLIENGVCLDRMNSQSKTALMRSTEMGHVQVVQLLVSQGANIMQLNGSLNETALAKAIHLGYVDIVKILVDKAIELNRDDFIQKSRLIKFMPTTKAEIVQFLLENGAHINIFTNKYENNREYNQYREYLRRQRQYRHLTNQEANNREYQNDIEFENAQFQFERDLESGTIYHIDTLYWACERGYTTITAMLIDKGANINMRDSNDETPLIKACIAGHKELAQFLIERGADVNIVDKQKRTCFQHLRTKYESINDTAKDSLRGLYEELIQANQDALRQKTLSFIKKNASFFIKGEHLIHFELLDTKKVLQLDSEGTEKIFDFYFLAYFLGFEFNEKIFADVINTLLEAKDLLSNSKILCFFEYVQLYSIRIEEIAMDLNDDAKCVSLIKQIDIKLKLVDELRARIAGKKEFLIRLANSISNKMGGSDMREDPLNEIDFVLSKYKDQKELNAFYIRIGFMLNEIKRDEKSCFRALSDEFYGWDKYHEKIHTQLREHLQPTNIDQCMEISETTGDFRNNIVLSAFCDLYQCELNIYQIYKEITTFRGKQAVRDINILFHKKRYASLIRIAKSSQDIELPFII